MSRQTNENISFSRRSLLKSLGLASLVLRPESFQGAAVWLATPVPSGNHSAAPPDFRFIPHYPSQSPLEDVLRLVEPGSDEFITEKYAFELETVLALWSRSSLSASAIAESLHSSITVMPLAVNEVILRDADGIRCTRKQPGTQLISGRERVTEHLRSWMGAGARAEAVDFDITAIEMPSATTAHTTIRYSLVLARGSEQREQRVGSWRVDWSKDGTTWQVHHIEWADETTGAVHGTAFEDVTAQAFVRVESYQHQLLRGSDYWRTVLDGACGIDVYGNNGVAAGDFDNDGFDDIYVSQPSGLPNRLYRNRGDGTFEDVTEKAGVGVLDNTACALFADFQNRGRQDLLVVCGSGPLLFLNQGNGTFTLKPDAFKFRSPPQGTFTHAALADYDGDGRLDIYFCLYSYYLGLDQYHYPAPYFDARNGPPNFLLHNEGNGTFTDVTEQAGLHAENDRYSFACAWGHVRADGRPDLFVANDFGRPNLYRNNGDGTFTAVSAEAHVDDPGAGMSATWADIDNDGNQDIYSANMWSAAGQRVAAQPRFHEMSPPDIRAFFQRHARGNSFFRNAGDGKFHERNQQAGVEMGRWSWSSDFWDFDHDGYSDLYITNGYISASKATDLASFFWRQVVARSPDDSAPSSGYEHGWNAINELIRSDRSWNGYERNVMYANNHDGTFTEVSGAVGLDLPEDSRSFALADFDHDGRLEVVVKNRNAPQVRLLHNAMPSLGSSVAFRLRGHKSNRDGIGAAITLEAGGRRQTKYLQAGSGFLAQHSKEVFFGVGKETVLRATVEWPSGLKQQFDRLPVDHRIEIEEGVADFAAKPFSPSPSAWSQGGMQSAAEQLPTQVETWLIEPLKAPEFSLPDTAGSMHTLSSLRGKFVLLTFWSARAPVSVEQLRLLNRFASRLQVVAINVDEAAESARVQAYSFPVLFATNEIAGVYNIIYRYLFDRRRDLALPTSFLLDHDGQIVKVYQGSVDPEKVLADVQSAPATAAARTQKALPFAGSLYQHVFQRNDFTYGVALFQHGYLDQAAESFQQVIATKPDDAEAYYNLGTLNLRRDELEQARQYLEQSLKLRPNYPEAWNNLGMIAAQQGQNDEAVKSFQQALLLRPDYATALLNLGNLYRRQRAYDQADQALGKALGLQPYDPEVNYSLGMLYAQRNQMDRAAEFLQKAVELRPDYPEALNNLGVLYVHQQDYAKAQTQFETCIRLVPSFDQSYFNLARLYAVQNQKEQAKRVLQQLLEREPDNANARQALTTLE